MEQRNYRPGEFALESMTLVNADGDTLAIEDIVVNFRMYESIYSKFVSADISIVDSLNILKNFKLVGQEYVRIALRGKENDGSESELANSIDKVFRVYKVQNNLRVDDKTQSYVLQLCEPRLFYLQKQRISGTWTGSWSQICLGVMQDYGNMKGTEIDFWEESDPSNVQFICPNWSVNKFLDYTIQNAEKDNSGSWKQGFFLFQTLNGGFRFMSMDEMCAREHGQQFEYRPKTSQIDSLNAPVNVPGVGLNSTILSYSKPQLFDTLRGTVAGSYSATMHVYDPLRKMDRTYHYDMKEVMDKGTHVSGNFPMVRLDEPEVILKARNQTDSMLPADYDELDADAAPNKAFDSVVEYTYTTTHSFGDATDVTSNEPLIGLKSDNTGPLERKALLETLQQNRIKFTVPLRTDFTVGSIVKLIIPEPELKRPDSSIESNVNDNRYLVTDMCMDADPTKNTGFLHIEAVKESFSGRIEDYRPLQNASGPERIQNTVRDT